VMDHTILGLHHVTAITRDAQDNVDFYTKILGLRLVKVTVNFDDPSSYHLYYGDGIGSPGTIMTFFAWPGATPGRAGISQVAATAFRVPPGSMEFWSLRFAHHGVAVEPVSERFGSPVLRFQDTDGMMLELVEDSSARHTPATAASWTGGVIPEAHSIKGFYGVTLVSRFPEKSGAVLTSSLGFRLVDESKGLRRYSLGGEGAGRVIDVIDPRTAHDDYHHASSMGAGTIHHIAFRVATDLDHSYFLEKLEADGRNPSPVMERCYFRSIYFREPGGILFELATDTPGFGIDESVELLGSSLCLPPWLEATRKEIQQALPSLMNPFTQKEVV